MSTGRSVRERTSAEPKARAERDAWIALGAVEGLGETLLPRLCAALGGAAAVLDRARRTEPQRFAREVREAAGVPVRAALATGIRAAAHDPRAVFRRVAELDGWVMTPWDESFPSQLRAIDPPPPVLFGRGDIAAASRAPLVAVVGTRRPTPGGRLLATRVATALATHGVTVVSGLAVGIDGAAHAAVAEVGTPTVAVIGGGLAAGVPRAHLGLAASILATGGAIVSELAPDVIPTKGTYPRRNRIISGLAAATIVVEAPPRSGALITARHALEQGRSLFVAPGRPGDRVVAGCLALLRETPARPLVGVEELLVDLGLTGQAGGASAARPGSPLDAQAALATLGPVERAVASVLVSGPTSIDAIVRSTGHPASVVAGALTLLQLRGWADPMGPLQLPAGPLLLSRSARAAHRDPT
jgi:DNA processing protein